MSLVISCVSNIIWKYLVALCTEKCLRCSGYSFCEKYYCYDYHWKRIGHIYIFAQGIYVYFGQHWPHFCGQGNPMPFNSVYKTLRTSHFYGLRDLISALPFFRFFICFLPSMLHNFGVTKISWIMIWVYWTRLGGIPRQYIFRTTVYFNTKVIFHFAGFEILRYYKNLVLLLMYTKPYQARLIGLIQFYKKELKK